MQKIIIATLLLFIATIFSDTAVSGEYWIKADATPTGHYTVAVKIETNIPGAIVLAVGLTMKGQKPDETFIGYSFVRAPILDGKAKITIDASKWHARDRLKLPASDYDVEVEFYPGWPENKVAAKAAKINDMVQGKDSIFLLASGQSRSSVRAAAAGQSWVIEHVNRHYPWNPEFWQNKFGKLQQIEYRGRSNPWIIKMYYIKSINMTLQVNVLLKEVYSWDFGISHK